MKNKMILVFLLLSSFLQAQVKEIGYWQVGPDRIKIAKVEQYYFMNDNGTVLKPIGDNFMDRSDITITNNTKTITGNGGIDTPNKAQFVVVSGFKIGYFYDPKYNTIGINTYKGPLPANEYTTEAKARARITNVSVVTPPVTPPVVNSTGGSSTIKGITILSAEKSDGISDLNSDGSVRNLWMKIISVNDSTITDVAWNYNPTGYTDIMWKIDLEDAWRTQPLVNFVIPKTRRGLPISISKIYFGGSSNTNWRYNSTVSAWQNMPSGLYDPHRTMQQLILPNGTIQQPLTVTISGERPFVPEPTPSWFSIPITSLIHDHFKNPAFPKDFTIPSNKYYWAGNIMPADVEPYNGKNPLLASGWSQVESNTNPIGMSIPNARKNQAYLMGDGGFANLSDPNNTSLWNFNMLKDFSYNNSIITFDWEHFGYGNAPGIVEKLREANTLATERGAKWGLWANGLVNINSLAINGITNSASLSMWDAAYNNPVSKANFLIHNTGSLVSNNFYYHSPYLNPSDLYQTMVAHELGKKINPNVLTIPAAWIKIEHVDGVKPQEWDIIKPNGQVKHMKKKYNSPAPIVYADILWGAVWDGLYHFETGKLLTDNKAYAHNEYDDSYESILTTNLVNVRGTNIVNAWKGIYYGFYNYTHLGLWQISQPHIKPIIETTSTEWTSPEYNYNGTWRTGNETRPHYAQYRKEPLIKYKISNDGTKALVIAQNPYNSEVRQVKIKINNNTTTIVLNAGWPVIGTVSLLAQ